MFEQYITEAAKVCISVTSILGVIAIVAVALRFYTRLRLQEGTLGADDWTILAALLLSTGIAILTSYVAATTGVGDPSFNPTLDQVIFALKANLGLENAQVTCMGLLKISFLLYYKRIFVSKSFLLMSNVLIGIVAGFEFSIVMALIFSKGLPVSTQWDPFVPFKLSLPAILLTFCSVNAILDIVTLILPITAVRKLQMSTNRKLLLSVLFSLGSFCILSSLVRLYYAVKYTQVPASGDSLFQAPFTHNILWALIEPPVFILAGCLLTLGPLFRSKYGPANLFRSLRSALLSLRTTSKATDHSISAKSKGDDAEGFRKLSNGSGNRLWKSNPTDITVDNEVLITEEAWELRDVGRTRV